MDVRDVKISERKQRYRGNEPGGSYSAGLSVYGVLPHNIARLDIPPVSVFHSHA